MEDSGKILYDGKTLEVKHVIANIAASQTAAVLVAGIDQKRIRVLAARYKAGGTATNLTFNSTSAAPADIPITALISNGANGGEVLQFNPNGWFDTLGGEALTVTTGAGSTTGIDLYYVALP